MKRSLPYLFILGVIACNQSGSDRQSDLHSFEYYEEKSRFYSELPIDSSLTFISQGLALARKNNDLDGQVLMLERFARINEQHHNLNLAIQYQKEAVSLSTGLKNEERKIRASATLGSLLAKNGDLDQGRALLLKALAAFQRINSVEDVRDVYTRMGDIDKMQKKYTDAVENYRKVESLGNPDSSHQYLAIQRKIGHALIAENDYRGALRAFEKGIKLTSMEKHPHYRLDFLQAAAKMHDTLGQPDSAISYHKLGLKEIKESQVDTKWEAKALIGLARAVGKKDTQEGIQHLRKALEIADRTGNKDLSTEIYRSLHILFKQSMQYQQAITALEAYHHHNDSLLIVNKEHQLAVLKRSYQLLQSRSRMEGLQIENEKRTFERNLYLALVFFVLFLLAIGGFYIYRINDLNKKLSASNSVKDKLFSIIGHDLRTPVGGITQALSLIEEGGIDEQDQRSLITEMRRQGEASLEILNSLLQWGQAQIKGIQVQVKEFSPFEVVQKNLELLNNQIMEKGISISFHIPEGLRLIGDQDHFDFVIRNLLSNAIKFSNPGGRVEVGTDLKQQPGKAVISIRDYGKGISARQQKKFSAGDMDITYGSKGEKGTGIGLTLSKEFVVANGGKLALESVEGVGSVFSFAYPCA